jgi:hypothetical protein
MCSFSQRFGLFPYSANERLIGPDVLQKHLTFLLDESRDSLSRAPGRVSGVQ